MLCGYLAPRAAGTGEKVRLSPPRNRTLMPAVSAIVRAYAVIHYQQGVTEADSGEMVPEGPLKCTIGTEQLDRIIGKAAYFLRTCDGAIDAKKVDQDVFSGEITELGLECFQATLSNLYAPLLENQVTPAPPV